MNNTQTLRLACLGNTGNSCMALLQMFVSSSHERGLILLRGRLRNLLACPVFSSIHLPINSKHSHSTMQPSIHSVDGVFRVVAHLFAKIFAYIAFRVSLCFTGPEAALQRQKLPHVFTSTYKHLRLVICLLRAAVAFV